MKRLAGLLMLAIMSSGCTHMVCTKEAARDKVMKDTSIPEDEKWMRIKTLDIEEDMCMVDYQHSMATIGTVMQSAAQGAAQSAPRTCTSQIIGNYVYTNCR